MGKHQPLSCTLTKGICVLHGKTDLPFILIWSRSRPDLDTRFAAEGRLKLNSGVMNQSPICLRLIPIEPVPRFPPPSKAPPATKTFDSPKAILGQCLAPWLSWQKKHQISWDEDVDDLWSYDLWWPWLPAPISVFITDSTGINPTVSPLKWSLLPWAILFAFCQYL